MTEAGKPASVRKIRVRFWGTRGSIAKPGLGTVHYGGNTSCVEVWSPGGTLVVIDCGTGAHDLGEALVESATGPLCGNLLISHTHWDHIQGLPFFTPLFSPENEWNIYAPRGLRQSIRDTLAGQMQYAYFPVSLERLGAEIHYHELVEGTFTVGEFQITTSYMNHPALTLGYRLEVDGVTLVYASDHEPHAHDGTDSGAKRPTARVSLDHPGDRRHAEFLAGADLVIHDSQYAAAEFPEKRGWGHSPLEYAVDMALHARVKRLALFHHDPLRDDQGVDELLKAGRRRIAETAATMELFAAAEGQVVELAVAEKRRPPRVSSDALEHLNTTGSMRDKTVVLGMADTEMAVKLANAIRADGVQVVVAADGDLVIALTRKVMPALVLLDRHLPGRDGISVCRALRGDDDPAVADVPVVLVSASGDDPQVALGTEAGVTDWLITPCSREYIRTKVSAWLLRTYARWISARVPPDEASRVEALHRLAILDTPPEERFDRLTRLAMKLFDVPIALVSLVDSERQWFKSGQGLSVRETSRDLAFCAHAILHPDVMVVADALQDPRFADNPLVTGEPHVRFYAGRPLNAAHSRRVGTLCIIDRRPRELSESDLQALQDLAALVERELNTPGP